MTNRFPIVLDTQDGNRLKEIPSGDNLDLAGSSIVNASSIETVGNLSALSLTVNGETLSLVAFSNDYNDLENLPTLFDGNYQDLANKPEIPSTTKNLDDVDETNPSDGDALIYNSENELYEPKPVLTELDLSNKSLNDLSDTLITGVITDRYLKFTAGAWRPSTVTWTDVKNKPTEVSVFQNDAGYLTQETLEETEIRTDLVGSVFADDSTLIIDAVNNKIIGDLTGSVFADDSTLIIDGVAGELPDYVKKQDLKDIVAASTDFNDFKTRIQDL